MVWTWRFYETSNCDDLLNTTIILFVISDCTGVDLAVGVGGCWKNNIVNGLHAFCIGVVGGHLVLGIVVGIFVIIDSGQPGTVVFGVTSYVFASSKADVISYFPPVAPAIGFTTLEILLLEINPMSFHLA